MTILKKLIFSLIICLMMMPLLQATFHPFPEKRVHGYFNLKPKPEPFKISRKAWLNSEYQSTLSANLEDNVNFRNYLFSINNQYDYSLFGISHALGFIAGKEGMLFEELYINEYTGRCFIGKSTWNKKVQRLTEVRQKLKENGTNLLFIFEPGKASFYPEYIPDRYHPEKRTLSNYEYLRQAFDRYSFPYLDLNEYFIKMKDTSRYTLFPKYGMHWSIYGLACAINPISGFIRKETGMSLPSFRMGKITVTDSLRASENDIGDLLNLAFPLPKVKAAYPEFIFASDTAGRPHSVLVISDSYYYSFEYFVTKGLFGKDTFWYYNLTVYPSTTDSDQPPVYPDKKDLAGTLKKYDVILLMSSEINLHCGFFDFADEAWLSFHPGLKEDPVYQVENEIRNNRQWFNLMLTKVRKYKTLEHAIHNDAEYMVWLRKNN